MTIGYYPIGTTAAGRGEARVSIGGVGVRPRQALLQSEKAKAPAPCSEARAYGTPIRLRSVRGSHEDAGYWSAGRAGAAGVGRWQRAAVADATAPPAADPAEDGRDFSGARLVTDEVEGTAMPLKVCIGTSVLVRVLEVFQHLRRLCRRTE